MTKFFLMLTMASILACDKDNPASSGMSTLTIRNELSVLGISYDIHVIQISPVGSDNWGNDRLGSNEILFYSSSKSFDLTNGSYDITAIDEDGDCYYKMGHKLKSDFTWRVTAIDYDSDCSYHSGIGKLVYVPSNVSE